MGDSAFTIQISTGLVNKLVEDGGNMKKKTKRPKSKLSKEPKSTLQPPSKVQQKPIPDDSKMLKGPPTAGWPLQAPLFAPTPPSQPASTELEAIRAVLQESEKVLEKLQKQEDNMLQEVTQRAKELHAKEFKLPEPKPTPCMENFDVMLQCYKENQEDPLKCASFVKDYAECARRVRQEVNSFGK